MHNLISIDLLRIGYGTEDVYHMDDIGLFYRAQPNKTLIRVTFQMMSLNAHFKSQKWKVLLIMDNYATHSPRHVGRGQSFGFSILKLSNITIVFLSPNVTSVVQPLDHGRIAPSIQYKKQQIKNGFSLSLILLLLTFINTIPKARHAIMQWHHQGRRLIAS